MREPDGTTRTTATRQCANCGTEIGAAKFCSNCGHPAFVDTPTDDLAPFPRHRAAAHEAAESVEAGALPAVRGVEAAERLSESTAPSGTPLFSPPPPPTAAQ